MEEETYVRLEKYTDMVCELLKTDVILHGEAGDIYGFIGHNGAGKTTTLKCVAGIQYLNFIADIFEISKKDREIRIRQEAETFGLTPALGDLISSYSHGMKQKLAIIGALIHKPKLLILDEPFVGLDPKATLILKNKMHELCAEGSACFFSTHVLDVAEKLCNVFGINEMLHTKDEKKKQRMLGIVLLPVTVLLLAVLSVLLFLKNAKIQLLDIAQK